MKEFYEKYSKYHQPLDIIVVVKLSEKPKIDVLYKDNLVIIIDKNRKIVDILNHQTYTWNDLLFSIKQLNINFEDFKFLPCDKLNTFKNKWEKYLIKSSKFGWATTKKS